MWRGERGQVVVLLPLLLVLVAGAAVGVARVGVLAVDRARAQTTADAAALAGALDGETAAEAVAAVNDGSLRSYRVEGRDTVVEAAVGEARAQARARRVLGSRPGGLAPAVAAVLARLEQLVGESLRIVPPALGDHPDAELHRRGLAVDLDPAQAHRVSGIAAAVGLCRADASRHPGHFRLCSGRAAGSGR